MTFTEHWTTYMNELGMHRIPFFFMIDFEKTNIEVYPLDQLPAHISYQSERFNLNAAQSVFKSFTPITFEKYPQSFDQYLKGFTQVKQELAYGNSFLLNYTMPTSIKTNLDLEDIFTLVEAKYKLLIKDRLTVFSPETFITIRNGMIASHPMKGTIDASIPDAQRLILEDEKELAEHYTIVDLIRNDLSRVSKSVQVEKFRYIDTIKNRGKDLLQVSSKITGILPANYNEQIGSILDKLLPAGSISGAPKKKTLEIIQEAEGQPRGNYTGIFGVFDGENLESAVAIRYIEQTSEGKVYRSGGGITHKSDAQTEYQEMIDKVYLPIKSTMELEQGLSSPQLVAQR